MGGSPHVFRWSKASPARRSSASLVSALSGAPHRQRSQHRYVPAPFLPARSNQGLHTTSWTTSSPAIATHWIWTWTLHNPTLHLAVVLIWFLFPACRVLLQHGSFCLSRLSDSQYVLLPVHWDTAMWRSRRCVESGGGSGEWRRCVEVAAARGVWSIEMSNLFFLMFFSGAWACWA